jgi:hypothetical protein
VTSLAAYILSLALASFPPGNKVHSRERLPECGVDPLSPSCELTPVCSEASILCAAPRWDDQLKAWVRVESREAGARRFEVMAQALADAAMYARGSWREGPTDLARAMLAASGWSTGLREDIQVGHTRGPAGEVCLMDLQPGVLRTAVPWDLAQLEDEELAQKVVGLEYPQLRRCFDAGAVMIVRGRRWSEANCKGWPSDYAMFSAYGMGASCHTLGRFGDYARFRARTFQKFRATRHTVFPDWYRIQGPARIADDEAALTSALTN